MNAKAKSKFRLGKLVLRGLSRNSTRTQLRRKRSSSAKRAKKILSPRHWGGDLLSQQPQVIIKEVIRLVPEVKTVPALPEASRLSTQEELSIQDLLHPSQKLKDCMEAFIFNQRSTHTQNAYSKDIKRFLRFLAVRKHQIGNEPLSRTHFIAYKSWLLDEKLEHTTVDRHLATLRSFCQWLEEDGFLQKNPVRMVRFMKPRRLSTTQGFSDEEVRKILKLPNLHSRTGAQHYAILMILFYCGLRRGEVCQLRTSSLGVEQGHRVLRLRGKGNKERIIPMIKPVWNAIQYFFVITGKKPGEDQYLFSPIRNNRTGTVAKPLDASMIYYIVTRYAKMAGVANKVSPHSCRATAISNARDQQVSDRAIQEFAGWSSPDMITRYDKRKTAVTNSAAHVIHYGSEDRSLPRWSLKDDEIVPQEEEEQYTPPVED